MKKNVIKFNKILKVNDSNSVSLEDLLGTLRRKFESDIEVMGPMKYLLEDVVARSKQINDSELEIHHSLDILKRKQEEIAKFILDLNKKKTMEQNFN